MHAAVIFSHPPNTLYKGIRVEGIRMELIKKNIHMDRIKCKASTQITMEDDINITDSRPDVYQLIEEQGEVVIDEIRAVQDLSLIHI